MRLTVDVDLIVDLDRDEALRAIDALVGIGLRPRVPVNPRDFADPAWRPGGSGTMTDGAGSADRWDATWEGARKQLLESTRAATPTQRLAWLEEMLELAHRAGALGTKRAGQENPTGQES